jgi:uroporphyrinogen decarboxylase
MKMTSRERFLTAARHGIPDRVPCVLGGSQSMLTDSAYFALLKSLDLGAPVAPFRMYLSRTSNYYDDRILDRLDTDARYLWSGFTELGGAKMDGDRLDAWGIEWKRFGANLMSVNSPLADKSADEIEAYPWPDPEKFLDFAQMKARVKLLKRDYPDKAIGARAVNSYGPFEQASELRGRENLYVDLLTEPELAALIMEKCTAVMVRAQELFLDAIGGDIDFLELPGDDYAGNEDLLISPELVREFCLPNLTRLVKTAKDFRPDLLVVFHSDGALAKILPDLVETGIDILNPMEPLPSTDWAAIKKTWGTRLSFMGGLDIKHALIGTENDVKADVRRCMDTFASGGGYILTASNHIQADVPPANVECMFRYAREFGSYENR